MNRTAPLALLALLAGLLPACSGPEPLGSAPSPIIGGSVDEGDPAVVLLISYPPDQSTFDTCTAAVIAPSVLLTAAHCLDPASHGGYTFGAFTGPDASAYSTAAALAPKLVPAKSVHLHPDYDPAPPFHADIGVVVLDQAVSAPPLPINRAAPSASLVGGPARIVGYGQATYGEFNVIKHEATTVVASIGAEDTIVVGDAERRSCVGDSGGPALVKIDGAEVIVGVDSYTETTGCIEPASYRRTDVFTGFLDTYAPPPAVDAGPDAAPPASAGDPPETGGCATAPRPRSGGLPLTAGLLLALCGGIARRRRAAPHSLGENRIG